MALTNEQLNERFSNPFQLVTYAIELAKQQVGSGNGGDAHLASDILKEILEKRELINEDAEEEGEEE